VTDQKRDESRDLGYFKASHVTLPWDCVHPDAVSFERFVPHSDLATAEERGKRWRKALRALLMKLHYHNVEPCRNPVTGLDLNEFDNLRMAMRDAESEMIKW
jgi:hypothetical protein